jgi:uncharacterized protein with PQ loop repeat
MIKQLISLGIDISMVLAPVIGYVDQYKMIVKERQSEAFSKLVSLILMLANVLRIFFWFGKRFETVMLYQSFVMIIAQFVMLHVCTRYPNSTQKHAQPLLKNPSLQNFWNWPDLQSYGVFIGGFSVVVAVFSLFLIPTSDRYVELLGYAALMTEACLGLPQLIQNFKNKSTEGFSLVLLGTWFLGDAYKTLFFIFKGLPNQFIACGAFQLAVDCLLLFQVLTYNKQQQQHRSNNKSLLH